MRGPRPEPVLSRRGPGRAPLVRERDQLLDVYQQRCTRIVRVHASTFGRHEKARAKLTGAAGTHISSTRRVRHCGLADIDIAAAFIWHNHAVSWASGDDSGEFVSDRGGPLR